MVKFVKLKTTEPQDVLINVSQIVGIEPVQGSARATEHVRIFGGGFKWLIQGGQAEVLSQLGLDSHFTSKEDK